MSSKHRRAKVTGKPVAYDEGCYAQVTVEVMGSTSYNAQPDYAKVVLFALAGQFRGGNNGNLSLVTKEAKALGVPHAWKLYAGLALLKKGDLILCTRQGRLERGKKLCSLYALTWRGVDIPPDNVTYDEGIAPCPLPTHAWAKWTMPSNWKQTVKDVAKANHGRSKIPVSTTVGNGRSTTVGTEVSISDQPRWGKETLFSVPTVVDTSEILGLCPTEKQSGISSSAPDPTPLSASKSRAADFAKKPNANRLGYSDNRQE